MRQTPLAQGRSSKTISMIEWIRTGRLPIKHFLSLWQAAQKAEGEPGAKKAKRGKDIQLESIQIKLECKEVGPD